MMIRDSKTGRGFCTACSFHGAGPDQTCSINDPRLWSLSALEGPSILCTTSASTKAKPETGGDRLEPTSEGVVVNRLSLEKSTVYW